MYKGQERKNKLRNRKTISYQIENRQQKERLGDVDTWQNADNAVRYFSCIWIVERQASSKSFWSSYFFFPGKTYEKVNFPFNFSLEKSALRTKFVEQSRGKFVYIWKDLLYAVKPF